MINFAPVIHQVNSLQYRTMNKLFILLLSFLVALCNPIFRANAQNTTDSVTVFISKGVVNGFTGEQVKNAKISVTDSIGKVLCDSIPLRYESEMTSAGLWERYSYLITIPYIPVCNILIEAPKYESLIITKQPSGSGSIGFRTPIEIFPEPKTKQLIELCASHIFWPGHC